ncbi:three component ABC system middle component [Paraburkholderia guartelaensis]|uniref:three component ABC system middle component n=1 Tax=Paraburkholderia guartelaensis TaxID=2546446 RepID=UPI002AB7BFDE|nr:three component ABC system middle component [Paraburkholderia guartelaensis]
MLLDEIDAIQNPGLGAALIWRSVCGFYGSSNKTEGCPAVIAFLVLPVIFNEDLREVVTKTFKSSGIRKFESKFDKQIDLLFSIQERAEAMRDLSRRSLALSLSTGLLTLSTDSALLWPRSMTFTRALPTEVLELASAAEKLGMWAQQTSLRELSYSLRLEL